MLVESFQAVATLLSLGILGFWVMNRKIVSEKLFPPLITLAIEIALPCMIFTNVINHFNPEVMTDWWLLPLWWLGFTLLTVALVFPCSWWVNPKIRKEFLVSLLFQNSIFFPVSMLSSMFGPNHIILVYLFLFVVAYPIYFFFLLPQLLSHKTVKFNWFSISNPTTLGTVLAVLLVLIGAHNWIPLFMKGAIKMVGQITIPIIFLIIGGNIYLDLKRRSTFHWKAILKFVAVKNFLFPLLFLILILIIKPPIMIAFIIILQAASPPLTFVPIMVEKEGGDRNIANQLLLFSFLTAIGSFPLIILLFNTFFPGKF